jgi:predicted O-methyltransferase YrrM
MIPYIGDISKQDAALLRRLTAQLHGLMGTPPRILEFGMGASTQVIAHYSDAEFTSVETEPSWRERTVANLELLGIDRPVKLELYKGFMETICLKEDNHYDLIFDDGVDGYRLEFARKTWRLLKEGGLLLFHDTRRTSDIKNVCELVAEQSAYISSVSINEADSNITVIRKRRPVFYENWNETEGRAPWQSGYAPMKYGEYDQWRSAIQQWRAGGVRQ